jgi:hypothetical protein
MAPDVPALSILPGLSFLQGIIVLFSDKNVFFLCAAILIFKYGFISCRYSRLLKNPAMSFRKHFLRFAAKNWHIRNPVKSMASPLSLWTPFVQI